MLFKVAVFQGRMGRRLSLDEKILIFKQQPDVVCLPEYFQIDGAIADYHRAALLRSEHLKYLLRLSEELNTALVGGTVVEAVGDRLYNACYVLDRGEILGQYYKRYPVPNEMKKGITPGEDTLVVGVNGVRVGVMICGDVFYPAMYDDMRRDDADVVVIPTTSPFRHDDTVSAKEERDRTYFLSGAQRAGALVAKVCGVGTLFGKPLQGRSLIAAPWGICNRIDFKNEDKVRLLTYTVDINELRDFRRHLPLLSEETSTPTDTSADGVETA